MKYFSILESIKNDVRFHNFHWKWPIFLSFPLFKFTLVIKLPNFDFKSHWNTLIFFAEKIYYVRFEYVSWKNVWFCVISIIWVHFSHEIEKLRFWKSLKYFSFFWYKKSDVRFKYAMSSSVWFGLSFVVSVEIWQ